MVFILVMSWPISSPVVTLARLLKFPSAISLANLRALAIAITICLLNANPRINPNKIAKALK
ncbi:Uncharacterised protein [Vibrio cholerae]|uniref:Uncharacterized protein n=1 Tax=Vibrio cholerae TaxID=666 RepID=A0A655WU92_VIBCL|nr:Uncharacterised protein [Vibrio cholerae]CSA18624.1 Uncharacterised protein [Vibrio cholerae]CSA41646.1 Uncharacterised protein [Vibrio cholerae]CSB74449.1 Uncharacterised protein [Vibrio cholerae]CSB87894.1 Uncharacterised protein [Vibrio cholerae]